MSFCCHTCNHRDHAVHATPSTPTLLDVSIVTLIFAKLPPSLSNPPPYPGLNTLLNNIIDAAESTSKPTRFTSWSQDLLDPKTVIVLTTESEICGNGTSPIFEGVLRELVSPPTVQHMYLDYSIVSLAVSSSEQTIPCDLMLLRAPNPGIAGAIGKCFGWDPKRSSLSSHLETNAPVGFSRPGDLVRDWWAWTELHPGDPVSPSSSFGGSLGSDYEGVLRSTNSDEKNMSLFFPQDDNREDTEDETLVMLFQWSSHTAADRFKHPLQKSQGLNGQDADRELWDRNVAHPVRQLQNVGAKVESYKLELRGVEERQALNPQENRPIRERSGSRRLSDLATGLSERVSGFWR